MLIIESVHLISVQSWTYLVSEAQSSKSQFLFMMFLTFSLFGWYVRTRGMVFCSGGEEQSDRRAC